MRKEVSSANLTAARALGRALVYGNLFVALCAASLVCCTLALAGHPLWHPLVGLVACATLFVYSLDRVAGAAPEDRVDPSPRLAWLARHAGAARMLGALGALGTGAFALMLPARLLVPLVPLGAISVAYGVPIVPWKGGWRRLKDIPGLKVFLIALVWATATVTLPLMSIAEDWAQPQYLGLFARRALFILAITLPFDVRDAARDADAGVRTLPHVLGPKHTRAVAWALMAGCVALDAWRAQAQAPLLVASAISVACTCALLLFMTRPRHDMYYALGLDGVMLAHTLCVVGALSL